jgi:3-hydroxyisobutyrate dehydrogenase
MARRYLTLCALLLLVPTVGATETDEAVRVPLNHYLKGHATGDASYMRKAFLPTAHIEGLRDGKLVSWTLEEYCALFTGKPAPDEASRVRTIDSVDVSGSAAMARATLVHGSTTFTDYFVLLKVDGEWKIANKVYSAAHSTSESR